MATAPTFNATQDIIKAKLRLSGVAAANDATEIINDAVLEVRNGFIRELGQARVAALVALPFTEDPVTPDQMLRALANQTEVKWVRLTLMRSLPILFQDGNADQQQIYHDEATFRQMTSQRLDAERVRLENCIQQNMDLLSGDEEAGSECSIRTDTPVSDETFTPNQTLFGGGQLGSHFI